MKLLVSGCVVLALCLGAGERKEERYDFRKTPAHAALTDEQRTKLDQVCRDFALLWGALDMYADHHGGEQPAQLADLMPHYLPELPRDPFATETSAAGKDLHAYQPSLGGWGYRYRRGNGSERAWVICSAGLPDFPFLAREGNVGLYVCKGTWISGINPVLTK